MLRAKRLNSNCCIPNFCKMLSKVIILNGLNGNGLAKCYYNAHFRIVRFVSFMYLHFSPFDNPTNFHWHIKVGFIWKQSDLWFFFVHLNPGLMQEKGKWYESGQKGYFRTHLPVQFDENSKTIWKLGECKRVQLFTIITSNRNVFRPFFPWLLFIFAHFYNFLCRFSICFVLAC